MEENKPEDLLVANNAPEVLPQNPTKKSNKKFLLFLFTFIFLGVLFLVLPFVLYMFFHPLEIKGNAMSPNYLNGQHYLTSYLFGNIKRGEVFAIKAPPEPEKIYIKRVIGLPGDTIMFKNGNVYLDGKVLDESSYIKNPSVKTYGSSFLTDGQALTVPAREYFVLGDNRQHNSDSRDWGFVRRENFLGKFLFCYYNCSKSS